MTTYAYTHNVFIGCLIVIKSNRSRRPVKWNFSKILCYNMLLERNLLQYLVVVHYGLLRLRNWNGWHMHMDIVSNFIWLSRASQMNVNLSWILLEGHSKPSLSNNYFRSHSPTVVVSVRINLFTVSNEYLVCNCLLSRRNLTTIQSYIPAFRAAEFCMYYLFISA